MDPNATLADLRTLLNTFDDDDDAVEILCDAADLFRALDEWLTSGGFLPNDWKEEN